MPMPSDYFRHSLWIIVVLVLLLTACVSRTLSALPTPSPAARPTRSLPASTALPSPSPSAMPATPTSQPTPGPDAYRLKAWTEQDALDAILEGEHAPEKLIHETQDYMYTLEREALVRFPKGKLKDEFDWKVAREEAIILGGFPEGAPVDGFLHQLGKALDSGQVTPDMLEAWLPNKGFDVTSYYFVLNLLGDGQRAQVIQIETQDWLLPADIVLAIAKSPQSGTYRLFSVRPYWLVRDSTRQALEQVTVVSVNGNKRPEIRTLTDSEFPAICRSELSLYEWEGGDSNGHFENIAGQVMSIEGDYWNNRCKDPWEFSARDKRGAQPLTATLRHKNWAGDECSEFQLKLRYEWNGVAYRWVSGVASLPNKSQPRQCLVGWAHAAAKHGLYDQAVPLIVSALADWPKEIDDIWGPSAKDLFRFKLGTWHIFQGNDDKGISTLEDVQDNPANPAFNMVARIAEKFLSSYRASKNADRTCFAISNWLLEEFELSGHSIAAWGFREPDSAFIGPGLSRVCDRGWRPDIPWDQQFQMPTPAPPPQTPEPTVTPSPRWVQKEAVQLIEKTLFIDGDSHHALQLIERLLATEVIDADNLSGIETVKPYLRYLLGLTHELSGDERKAVDNYWHVWHDYPDSLYSKIAEQKLERIAP